MTRKTQGWFRRWGCSPSDAASAASPAPGAAPRAGASTPAKDTAPVPSDDEDGAVLITPERADSDAAASPILALATLPTQGRA